MRTKEADHILDMTVKAIVFPDSSKYTAPFELMDEYNICPNKSYPIILSKSNLSRINAWESPGQKGGSKNYDNSWESSKWPSQYGHNKNDPVREIPFHFIPFH